MRAPRRRFLVVCDSLPLPIRRGSDLRTMGIVKALARLGDVGVVSLSSHAPPPPPGVALWRAGGATLPDTVRLLQQVVRHPDDPFGPYAAPAVVEVVRATVEAFRPDVAVFYRLQTWRLAHGVLGGSGVAAVLDLDESTDRAVQAMEVLGRRDPTVRLRAQFTRAAAQYEKVALAEARSVWVSSPIEVAHVAGPTAGRGVFVVPNAVDVHSYAATSPPRVPRRLVFPATFSYPPNEEAAREIVERLAPALRGHTFELVGSHVPAWLQQAAVPNVTVVGPVADVAPHLRRSSATVIPLRAGTGTRMKVLESLAAGTPVISTAVGAEGLGLEPGRDYLAAESTDDFVRAIGALDDDPGLAGRLGDSGARVVQERYSIEALAARLEEVLAGSVGG